jgi:hypothetical protein
MIDKMKDQFQKAVKDGVEKAVQVSLEKQYGIMMQQQLEARQPPPPGHPGKGQGSKAGNVPAHHRDVPAPAPSMSWYSRVSEWGHN